MKILLTNDDGIEAVGFRALEDELRGDHDVLVCAPDREQSAASHSLSMSRPLRLFARGEDRWACDGTPTDCVLLAVSGLLKGVIPDMIISGINHGQNMGDDVTYSGTVAAAIESSILGAPAIAVSMVEKDGSYPSNPRSFAAAARFLRQFLSIHPKLGLDSSAFLNINFPDLDGAEYSSYQFTCLGLRIFKDVVVEKTDPRGHPYYWIAGKPIWTHLENSDYSATSAGDVSISPLKMNFSDRETGQRLGLGLRHHLGASPEEVLDRNR